MRTRKWETKDVAAMGLLIALTIIASRFIRIELAPWLRLTFSSAFVMLSGIWFGPVGGALVGGIADLLGCVISGYAPFLPLTLSPIMVGIFCGLLSPVFRRSKNPLIYAGLIAGITLFTTVLYGTWCMTLMYGTSYWALIGQRVVQAVLSTILNTIVVYVLYRSPVTQMLYSERARV